MLNALCVPELGVVLIPDGCVYPLLFPQKNPRFPGTRGSIRRTLA